MKPFSLESLKERASGFAGMVSAFCQRMGFTHLELLISKFQVTPHLLNRGCKRDFHASLSTDEQTARQELAQILQQILATWDFFRSADNSVRMFDRRNLTSNGVGTPVYKFEGHKAAVLCVQVLISSGNLVLLRCCFYKFLLIPSIPFPVVSR